HVHVGGYHAPGTLGYVRRLTLIRHAMTGWNLSGRFQGVADIPLNDQGRRQARRLARYVEGLEGDAEVWSSPLIRAVQTAELAFPGRELQLDARLRELNFGDFEGKTQAQNEVEGAWATWMRDPFELAPPGGESYSQLRVRATEWMHEVAAGAGAHVVAVQHSGTIQLRLPEA